MANINQSKQKRYNLFLYIGGLFFIGIGIYHVLLPYVWHWKEFTNRLPDLIEWAVYAINFLMSALMIILGVATLYTVNNKSLNLKEKKLLYLICLIFWVLNFAYQLVNPTPIPEDLILLKVGFLIPPILCIFIYGIPFYNLYSKEK